MSARTWFSIGLAVAAVALGGWRMLLPGTESTSNEVGNDVSAMLSTTTRAAFTGAAASLDAQRTATGSYAGAQLTSDITLVRADGTSYCVQTQVGSLVEHEAGPGGSPQAGPC